MDEHDDLELEREKEKAQRQERNKERRKTVRRQIAILAVIGIFITAGLIFGLSRAGGKKESSVEGGDSAVRGEVLADAGNVTGEGDGEWEEAAALSYETFAEDDGIRETLAAGHIWEDLPKMDVLISICPLGRDWTAYSPDNRCVLAPVESYLTGMKATLRNQPEGMTGTVQYSVNVSGYGWIDWVEDTAPAGSDNTDITLEAICMRLSGELADYYDILYSVYQNGVWTDWMRNGEEAGEAGVGLRVDGIRASVSRKWPGEPSYAGEIDPSRPMVALTYDDGPSKSVTPRILDKLESVGGRATFFMVGQQVERNPEIVNRVVQMGCEVGNHTFDHTEMVKLTQEGLLNEIQLTSEAIYNCTGIRPLIVRPPGGNETDSGMDVLGYLSMPAILWSVDTRDWKTRDAAQTINTVLTTVQDGDIVLMHDLYDATGDASMTIIDELVARGYQLVTVSELSAYRGGLEPEKSYKRFKAQ